MDFIIVNGEIVKKSETGFTSFFWDEPFIVSRKLWFGFGGIPLFHENIVNFKLELSTLSISIPDLLNDEFELFRLTKRMLNKNRFFRSGIITCQVFDSQLETGFVISTLAFPDFSFPISNQGLILNFSEFNKYSVNPLNRFSFFNLAQWKFAETRNQETSFNNSIFLNENGVLCDCISANLFMIKGKVLYTPSVETGCYVDSLRNHVISVAAKVNLKVIESDELKREDLLQMNEIFLASEEHGIEWVLGVENKRYVHNFSVKIHEILNDHLKKMIK